MPRPDLQKFLTDPEFQADRELFEGTIENYLKKKKAEHDAANPEPDNIFDAIFGSKKQNNGGA